MEPGTLGFALDCARAGDAAAKIAVQEIKKSRLNVADIMVAPSSFDFNILMFSAQRIRRSANLTQLNPPRNYFASLANCRRARDDRRAEESGWFREKGWPRLFSAAELRG
jgi:hypothetical protein